VIKSENATNSSPNFMIVELGTTSSHEFDIVPRKANFDKSIIKNVKPKKKKAKHKVQV
jgi:hypothetical protein